MTQKRTFTLTLKNDQTIVLEFAPIAATGDRLWQMFATTEALDTVDHIIGVATVAEVNPEVKVKTVAKTKLPAKSTPKVETKSTKKK
jgi:hypothetical protein